MPERLKAETIITAHANADFDALAAIVAAGKLYPGAVLIFPGSQERNLRQFFIQSATYLYNFKSMKEVDPSSVRRLVVVDTRQRSRISHVSEILDMPGIEIHAYDHHPDSSERGEDVIHSEGIIVPWGSTSAILCHELIKRGVSLTPDEATLLGLGIYEDTGAFTFNSTTEHDLSAAAWLRSQGMELDTVREVLHRDLNADQVAILSTMLETAETHDINGVPVTFAEATTEEYIGDFALLAHKLLDMENIRVLFALGRMHDRVQVVARSRTPDVDVGHICSSLGGGGHSYAASASVKDRPPSQIRDEIFGLLYSHVNPQILVRDLMSHPPVVVDSGESINFAEEMMMRYGLKAVPVVRPGTMECEGFIEHELADRAKAHGLGKIPVAEYMNRACAVISPAADLYPVMEIIIGQRQRLVPVVEDGDVVGVITRTDLINTIVEDPARMPESLLPEKRRERNIRNVVRERVPEQLFNILQLAGNLAEEIGQNAYAVGGFVRDIILRRPNLDLDIVVEGDGISFARKLAGKLDGRVRAHHKFRTAVVLYPDPDSPGIEQRIDVATARLEYYAHPAALPTVELSSIKMDLYRRDFTINALALQLNPGQFGRLVDFFGSQKDIKAKAVRVLHSLSFVEDPTRILRAVRFEQRFGFAIGRQTERLIRNAVNLDMIRKLSGSRIMHELRLIFDEESPVACLKRLQQFGILTAVHPRLDLTPAKLKSAEEMEKVFDWYRLMFLEEQPEPWKPYLLVLCGREKEQTVLGILDRLNLPPRDLADFRNLRALTHRAADGLRKWQRQGGSNSELDCLLKDVPLEGMLFLMARMKEELRKPLSAYLTQIRGISIEITGEDLIGIGMPPGPAIGDALTRVRAARIDGEVTDRQSELEFARRIAPEALRSETRPCRRSRNRKKPTREKGATVQPGPQNTDTSDGGKRSDD